jgi:hypothetical protein
MNWHACWRAYTGGSSQYVHVGCHSSIVYILCEASALRGAVGKAGKAGKAGEAGRTADKNWALGLRDAGTTSLRANLHAV